MTVSTKTFRLVVMVSGNGTNLQAILDACAQGDLPAEVVLVVSNKSDAYALKRAANMRVPCVVQLAHSKESRTQYDQKLAQIVCTAQPDYIVLAGWMRLLSHAFLQHFPNRVINIHPALSGELPGVNAVQRAYAEFQQGKRQYTGVMVHLVPDEGVDSGPVLQQQRVDILPNDTLDNLLERMHKTEHQLLMKVLERLLSGG